jgi:transcriptional regulator with XRE-family HTH domain
MRARRRALLDAYAGIVRAERERQGLPQRVVANRAGVSIRHLRNIEHARVDPSFFTLVDVAERGLGRPFVVLVTKAEQQVAVEMAGADKAARDPPSAG